MNSSPTLWTGVSIRRSVQIRRSCIWTCFGKKKGFGLGFEVVKENDTKFGSKGTFGWGGMFGTYFRIDPVEKMIFIYMTQSFETYNLKLSDKFRSLVYESIIK